MIVKKIVPEPIPTIYNLEGLTIHDFKLLLKGLQKLAESGYYPTLVGAAGRALDKLSPEVQDEVWSSDKAFR